MGRIPKGAGGREGGAVKRQAVREAGSRAEVVAYPSTEGGMARQCGLPFQSLSLALTQNKDSHTL